jgi:hypothetical protein
VILGHGAVPLGLGLAPAHLTFPGDPSPLRDQAGKEEQNDRRHNHDYDDCDS